MALAFPLASVHSGAHDAEGFFHRACLVTERLPNPSCVVKVGEGRGFVIEYRVKFPYPAEFRRIHHTNPPAFKKHRVVVTAAHCLPKFPAAHAAAHWYERTYGKLLGSLDGGETKVYAECLFVDPIADIAVLGSPESQVLAGEDDAYHELTDNVPFLRIDNARSGRGWVHSLDGHWVRTTLKVCKGLGGMGLSTTDEIEPGMSGSPFLNDAGRAVGVVAVGPSAPQPMLMRNLPGWLLQFQG